jgi:gas vesicle protein
MSNNNKGDLGNFFAGFFIGGIIGAIVAMLYAPQSGEETRMYIKDKSIELKDTATESAIAARQRAEELAQDARSRAAELQQSGQVVLDEQVKRFTKTSDDAKVVVEETDIEVEVSVDEKDS